MGRDPGAGRKPWQMDIEEDGAGEENERPDAPASTELDKGGRKKEAKETDPLLSDGGDGEPSAWNNLKAGYGLVPYLRGLHEHFGYKLLILLVVCQHVLKGFVNTLYSQATPYMYKKYNIHASQVQIYNGVTMLPWSMKPVIGLISDIFPVIGYNKAPYILLTTTLGTFAALYLASLPARNLPITFVVIGLFLMTLQLSTSDLLSEAKYAEKIAISPAEGPAMLTFVWAGLAAAGIAAVLLSGPIINDAGPRLAFLIAAIPMAILFVPVLLNYFEETPVTSAALQRTRAHFYKQKEACMLCVLMFTGSVVIIIVGLVFESATVNCIVSSSVGVVMLIGFSVTLNPVIAKFNAWALIQTSIALSTSGATFYFYTDTHKQYEDGPHFSPYFYNTVLGTVGQVMSLLGVVCYQKYFSSWKYRHLILMTNIVYSLLSVFDVLMFARLNKGIIPDHLMVLGLSVFETVVAQWMWMPQVVILAFLCPKGMEATMYALLAGCHNLGNTIASHSGALLLERLGCEPEGADGEDEQFKNLWIASVVSSACPLVSVMVLYHFIPDAHQNERLVGDRISDATAGSLWRRWFGSPSAED